MQKGTMAAQLRGCLIPPDAKDGRLGGMVELLMEHMELAEKWEFEVSLHLWSLFTSLMHSTVTVYHDDRID